MLFDHETSFILRYQYVNKMNRIRKQFSIEWYGQNKVLYGPKHGLYKKNLCQTLFCHETSFPSSKRHQSGTIWIRKSFSIDLDGQNQVPYDQNSGLYKILSKIIDFLNFFEQKKKLFKCSQVFLVSFGAAGTGFRVIPDQKISKKKFGPKSVFFDQKKP